MIYEYKRIFELIDPFPENEIRIELGKGTSKLNELGKEGWRLVSVVGMRGGIAYILERAIKQRKWEQS